MKKCVRKNGGSKTRKSVKKVSKLKVVMNLNSFNDVEIC